jgi:hypothetical protein
MKRKRGKTKDLERVIEIIEYYRRITKERVKKK